MKGDKRSMRREDAFTPRPGEDVYESLNRQFYTLPYSDLPRIMMMRYPSKPEDSLGQIEAIKLFAQLKMVVWTRALVFGTFFLGIATIVAALIVAGN